MVHTIEIKDPADDRLDAYRRLKDNRHDGRGGTFVGESELVVQKMLRAKIRIESILATPQKHLNLEKSLGPGALTKAGDFPIYLASNEVLSEVAGFPIHRGCLAIGRRPSVTDMPKEARRIVVLEDLVDVDNVGAAIRNAAAFDIDAIVLSPRCADPFYRKAIRVSMGSVFFVPIIRAIRWPSYLRELGESQGLPILGAALDEGSIPVTKLSETLMGKAEGTRFHPENGFVLVLGAEAPGLTANTKAACDHLITVPMATGKADSLNVATAGAVMLYHLTQISFPHQNS